MTIPSIVGFIFLLKENKFKTVIKALFRFRISKWIIFSILLIPVSIVIIHLINILFLNGNVPIITEIYFIPLQFIGVLIIGGPLPEEIGWRGFLQNKIKQKYSTIITGFIVGIIWVIWHLPLFLIREMPQSKLPLDQFILTLIFISIIISFFQVKANCGIWPALLLHSFLNLSNEVTPLFNDKNHTLWIIANCVLFMFVIIFTIYEVIQNKYKRHTSSNQTVEKLVFRKILLPFPSLVSMNNWF